jgi:gliding motility-associated-like protein
LTEASRERSNNGSTFTAAATLPPAAPLILENTLTDDQATADAGQRFFRVNTKDVCGTTLMSNQVATIFLKGQALEAGGANALQWTAYQNNLADTLTYQLFRAVSGGGTVQAIASLGATELKYDDNIDFSKPDLMQVCYYVEATAQLVLPDGTLRTVVSRSNTVCLEQPARIYIPNVFAPAGINAVFQPILPFGEPAGYHMIIYDRWGGQVFESNSIDTGWDGKKKGKAMPQGVYLYYIRLEQNGGRVIEKTGDVMLMR